MTDAERFLFCLKQWREGPTLLHGETVTSRGMPATFQRADDTPKVSVVTQRPHADHGALVWWDATRDVRRAFPDLYALRRGLDHMLRGHERERPTLEDLQGEVEALGFALRRLDGVNAGLPYGTRIHDALVRLTDTLEGAVDEDKARARDGLLRLFYFRDRDGQVRPGYLVRGAEEAEGDLQYRMQSIIDMHAPLSGYAAIVTQYEMGLELVLRRIRRLAMVTVGLLSGPEVASQLTVIEANVGEIMQDLQLLQIRPFDLVQIIMQPTLYAARAMTREDGGLRTLLDELERFVQIVDVVLTWGHLSRAKMLLNGLDKGDAIPAHLQAQVKTHLRGKPIEGRCTTFGGFDLGQFNFHRLDALGALSRSARDFSAAVDSAIAQARQLRA